MAVDLSHRYLNESGGANWDIYDDFKLKKPLVAIFFYKLIQRFKG